VKEARFRNAGKGGGVELAVPGKGTAAT